MLTFLFAFFVTLFFIDIALIIGVPSQRGKLYKITVVTAIISLILAIPTICIEKTISKNIETSVSKVELAKDNFYMLSAKEEYGKNLFLCKDTEGEFFYISAYLEEIDSSMTSYLEKTQYLPTKAEKFLALCKDDEYVIYSSPEHVKLISNLSDISLDEFS